LLAAAGRFLAYFIAVGSGEKSTVDAGTSEFRAQPVRAVVLVFALAAAKSRECWSADEVHPQPPMV